MPPIESTEVQPPSPKRGEKPAFHIVLCEPEIPNNTGNIGRTAAATGCRLHIIHPIGFDMSEKARRRAGLDYWHLVDCREHASWERFLETERPGRLWLFSTKSERNYWDATLTQGDYLLFGRETRGVSDEVRRTVCERWGSDACLLLPMVPILEARSLNLATAAAIAVYEGLRQLDSKGGLPW